jgi:hypothetical protein|mmetsp:Transcript_109242/g.223144  ORF Transcript_109242/g.223144 Transcript_109242/m.223144 type:complete len:120 (+) Transcript_109242:317-676(+)
MSKAKRHDSIVIPYSEKRSTLHWFSALLSTITSKTATQSSDASGNACNNASDNASDKVSGKVSSYYYPPHCYSNTFLKQKKDSSLHGSHYFFWGTLIHTKDIIAPSSTRERQGLFWDNL